MQKYAAAVVAVLAAISIAPAFAADRPMSGLIQVAADHDHDHGAQSAKGTKGRGVVNSVDAAGHKLNISHEPIPSLKWPAMKMDFAVAPSVDLKAVQAGAQIEFVVSMNKDGLPEIQTIQPVKK